MRQDSVSQSVMYRPAVFSCLLLAVVSSAPRDDSLLEDALVLESSVERSILQATNLTHSSASHSRLADSSAHLSVIIYSVLEGSHLTAATLNVTYSQPRPFQATQLQDIFRSDHYLNRVKDSTLQNATVGHVPNCKGHLYNSTLDRSLIHNSWLQGSILFHTDMSHSKACYSLVNGSRISNETQLLSSEVFDTRSLKSDVIRSKINRGNTTNSKITSSELNDSSVEDSSIVKTHLYESTCAESNLSNSVVSSSRVVKSSLFNSQVGGDSEVRDTEVLHSEVQGSRVVSISKLTNSRVVNSHLVNCVLINSTVDGKSLKSIVMVNNIVISDN